MRLSACARSLVRLAQPALVGLLLIALPAAATAASCNSTRWIGAWEAAPSDASGGTSIEDLGDPSVHIKQPVDNETIRAVLTPTYGGSTIRVHLANRFGTTPVTFGETTIARKGAGASLAGPVTRLTFGGSGSVTVAPGQDVISDPVHFTFSAMQTLAVSMFVSNDPEKPTEHYTARQTSYLTDPGTGNHAADTNGSAFVQQDTSRPYVEGIDVLAPASAGAVVTLGDSITDGYQGVAPPGLGEVKSTLDRNGRWPDDLARRLIAARIPLSVLNAGIGGNRILQNGAVGGNTDTFGPSALSRLDGDVLHQAGVTTVIWLEGINDIGQTPNATATQIEAGYTQGIAVMHAAGLKVLQGTLTPSGGSSASSYGDAAANQERQQINQWILTKSPADGVINFAAAVQDPSDPSIINPTYDGGDHLHFNLAGYQAMANAIKLKLLRRVTCTVPKLKLTETPRTIPPGKRVVLRFLVTAPLNGHQEAIKKAIITIDRHRLTTNSHGRATITVRFSHPGPIRARATARGYTPASHTIRIRNPRAAR
jgi:lysophospholipase L1-like esterase